MADERYRLSFVTRSTALVRAGRCHERTTSSRSSGHPGSVQSLAESGVDRILEIEEDREEIREKAGRTAMRRDSASKRGRRRADAVTERGAIRDNGSNRGAAGASRLCSSRSCRTT